MQENSTDFTLGESSRISEKYRNFTLDNWRAKKMDIAKLLIKKQYTEVMLILRVIQLYVVDPFIRQEASGMHFIITIITKHTNIQGV